MATLVSPIMLALAAVVLSLHATTVAGTGYCPSYCDMSGQYHDARHCHYAPDLYCCGSGSYMTCCPNKTQDVTGYYPEQYNCQYNSWFEIHWQVMITMTGTIIIVMLFAACCCQCCKICGEKARQREQTVHYNSSSHSGPTVVTDADGNQFLAEATEATGADQGQVRIQVFDPESPFAFTPPEYEQLPKEPPKYNEVFGGADGGTVNPCYVPDTPPPTFIEAVGGATIEPRAERPIETGTESINPATELEDDMKTEATPLDSEPSRNSDEPANRNVREADEAEPLNQGDGDQCFVEVSLNDDNATSVRDVVHRPSGSTTSDDAAGQSTQS